MTKLNEAAFESSLCDGLIKSGYEKLSPAKDWDIELSLCSKVLLDYIRDSQPNEWAKLPKHYGATVDKMVIAEIVSQIKKEGMLAILRNGIRGSPPLSFQLGANLLPPTFPGMPDFNPKGYPTLTKMGW